MKSLVIALFLCVSAYGQLAESSGGAGAGGGGGVSLPTQTGNAGKTLLTDGTNASWGGVEGYSFSGGQLILDGTVIAELAGNNAFSGITAFTPSTAQALAAGTAILANATHVRITATGATTLTATPLIADSVLDGQVLIVHNTDTADAITIPSGSANNTKLCTGAATVLAIDQSMMLMWDTTASLWTEIGCASASATPAVTLLGKGGSSTTYSITAEAATGVAPNFSVTVPAAPPVGTRVSCLFSTAQQDVSVNGHAAVLRMRAYLDTTLLATVDDTAGSLAGGQYRFEMMIVAGSANIHTSIMGVAYNASTYQANASISPVTVTTTSATLLEFRPFISSGAGDDTFSITGYSCTLVQ